MFTYEDYCNLTVNSQKNIVYKNANIKGNAEEEEEEEKKRQTSSAKIYKSGVDRSFHLKDARRSQPKSATLSGFSSKRPLPSLNGTRTEKTPINVQNYRQNVFPESPGSRFNDVFYSPVMSENKTFHDACTLEVLQTEFSAPSRSTYGLSRAASPENIKGQERYWALVNNAIESNVVTPLSNAWIENTHCFIPVELRDRFANILERITKVNTLRYILFLVQFYTNLFPFWTTNDPDFSQTFPAGT